MLNVIFNCARAEGIGCYFIEADLKAMIGPFCKSKDLLVNINAKTIMALTQDKLTDESICYFQLTSEECQAIISALQRVSTSNESTVTIIDYIFSEGVLLSSLKHLLACDFNRHMIAEMEVVPFLAVFMMSTNPAMKVLSCHIILTLLMVPEFKKAFLNQDLPLLEMIEDLATGSNDSEVKNIALCLLDDLGYSDKGMEISSLCLLCTSFLLILSTK